MQVKEYVRSGETVYCQTSCKKGRDGLNESGSLACTDSRLIYSNGKSILDVSLTSIDEIEYIPKNIPWPHIATVLSLLAVGLLAFVIGPDIQELPDGIHIGIGFLALVICAGALVDVFRLYGPLLVVKTDRSTHRFRDGNLADFPHVIRGAA